METVLILWARRAKAKALINDARGSRCNRPHLPFAFSLEPWCVGSHRGILSSKIAVKMSSLCSRGNGPYAEPPGGKGQATRRLTHGAKSQ
jgi:hypothetical protein